MPINKMETSEDALTAGDDGFEDEGFAEDAESDYLTIPSLDMPLPDLHAKLQRSTPETSVRKKLIIPLEPHSVR